MDPTHCGRTPVVWRLGLKLHFRPPLRRWRASAIVVVADGIEGMLEQDLEIPMKLGNSWEGAGLDEDVV